MRLLLTTLFCLNTLWLLTGCFSPKKVIYANDLVAGMDTADIRLITEAHKIQVGDLVQVLVGAADPDLVEVYNPLQTRGGGGGGGGGAAGAGIARGRGYKVDERGQIELPQVGRVIIAGLTTEQAARSIQSQIARYIVDPFVNVAVLNFRVSVLGGVRSPGQVTSLTDRLTILEALAQSGDILPTSLRDRVWVIRENNGERSFAQVNLNSRHLFKSEYYYLRNNDLVYVQPNAFSAYMGANAPVFSSIGALAGVLALILTFLR